MIKGQILGMGRHQRIVQHAHVGVNTRPAVSFGTVNHRRPNRVQFDVAVERHEVALCVYQAGFEPALPERAAAAVASIERLDVALTGVPHGQRQGARLRRGQ